MSRRQDAKTAASWVRPFHLSSPNCKRRQHWLDQQRFRSRSDYPVDFLNTVERIWIICDCLDKLECFAYHLRKVLESFWSTSDLDAHVGRWIMLDAGAYENTGAEEWVQVDLEAPAILI